MELPCHMKDLFLRDNFFPSPVLFSLLLLCWHSHSRAFGASQFHPVICFLCYSLYDTLHTHNTLDTYFIQRRVLTAAIFSAYTSTQLFEALWGFHVSLLHSQSSCHNKKGEKLDCIPIQPVRYRSTTFFHGRLSLEEKRKSQGWTEEKKVVLWVFTLEACCCHKQIIVELMLLQQKESE